MTNRLVQALIKATPELIFLVFSRRVFISSVSFWRELFSPRAYVYAIDTCLKGLFGWSCANLLYTDKIVAYQHLYAFTSSKLIAHWFQIMREKRFQMFDEGSPVRFGEGPLVPTFNLRNIKTPIALFLGGLDTLVDNKWTKEHLKSVVRTVEISDYEHLDFLWGKNIDEILFPEIFDILSK
jgi:lysosomal acid lipase/cholesteryl ester hydrolase